MCLRRCLRWLLVVIAVIFVVVYLVFIYIVDYSPYVYGVRHADEIVAGGMQLMDLVPEGCCANRSYRATNEFPSLWKRWTQAAFWSRTMRSFSLLGVRHSTYTERHQPR